MKILVTGGKGQLGSELQRILQVGQSELGQLPSVYEGTSVVPVDADLLDITDIDALREFTAGERYDAIINCAAMTNVDGCEEHSDAAYCVNAVGARNVARVAEELGCKLAHISTDYVFSGQSKTPYAEWDAPNPHTVYGKSKLLGEQYAREVCRRLFIIRTAWLYSYVGTNFVKTILRTGREREKLCVVNDQMGNPTNATDLAHHILLLLATENYGLYHCTGEGVCSWFDFAEQILHLAGMTCAVSPCTTSEYPLKALRPAYSALDNMALRATIGNGMRNWKDALASFMMHYDRTSEET